MKILFTIGNLKKGGAERVIANLSNFLIKNHEVIIVTTTHDEIYYELDNKIKVYHLDEAKELKKGIIIKNIKRIRMLNKIIKLEVPDLAVSFLPEPSYRLMLIKKNLPSIISVRNDPKIEYKSLKNKILMKMLYPKADGFVFQTEEARACFSQKIQEKSCVIPNPISQNFVGDLYSGKRKKTIVNVGRLTEQKNQLIIIDAFYNIQRKYKNYTLKIYGDGNLKPLLTNRIKELNLEKKVFLMGEVNNIQNVIRKDGMFVLSSNYEGMPNALMEAMALGLPCISTDCPCGGPRFLIKNDFNGILVAMNSVDELAGAMEKIILDQEFANFISKNAHKICNTLNPLKINKKWENYMRQILQESNRKKEGRKKL